MTAFTSLSEMQALLREVKTIYGELHSAFRDDEKYYDLDVAEFLNLPAQFVEEGVVLPTAREVVDTAADHVTPASRRVVVPRRKSDKKGTAQAMKLRLFYEALLTSYERPGTSSPFRQGAKNLARLGMLVFKQVFDKGKYPDAPSRSEFKGDDEGFEEAMGDFKDAKKLVMPFRLQLLHPVEVFPDPFHDEPEWVMQVSEKYVMEIKQAYPNWPNSNNNGDLKKIEVVEYWDDTHRAVLADKESALKGKTVDRDSDPETSPLIRHRWGAHPYIIQASGLGVDDHLHRPEKKYVSYLRYIKQVLLSESRQYSIADIVMKGAAWPVRAAEGERANEMPNIKLEYGTLQPLPPGVKITDLTPQLPAEMIFSFMQLSNSVISSATAPRIVRGLHQPGVSSGFDRQLALGEARLRYGSLAEAMEAALAMICQKAGILMERVVTESVHIMAHTNADDFQVVNGRDFKNHHAVDVKVNVLEPEDEVRKHQDAIALVAGGLMAPQTAIRKFFPDVDPDTELGRILAARLLFSPQVMGLLSQGVTTKLAEKVGLEEILAQILQAAQDEQETGGRGRSPRRPERAEQEPRTAGSRSDQADNRELDLRELGQ